VQCLHRGKAHGLTQRSWQRDMKEQQ